MQVCLKIYNYCRKLKANTNSMPLHYTWFISLNSFFPSRIRSLNIRFLKVTHACHNNRKKYMHEFHATMFHAMLIVQLILSTQDSYLLPSTDQWAVRSPTSRRHKPCPVSLVTSKSRRKCLTITMTPAKVSLLRSSRCCCLVVLGVLTSEPREEISFLFIVCFVLFVFDAIYSL